MKPTHLLPLLIRESDSSTNFVYINKSTHEELLEQGGRYAELYAGQFAGG